MAAISGANPIVASDVNNFTGELFKITPHRTPLLAAAGGLNGGIVTNTTFFPIPKTRQCNRFICNTR